MKVRKNNKFIKLHIDTVYQEYTDTVENCVFQHMVGITRSGKQFHIIKDVNDTIWEVINPYIYN